MPKPKLIGGVVVIVRADGKHLLVQQGRSKPHRMGLWRHPGGKFKEDEDYHAGLKREIKEELNLDIEFIENGPVAVMASEFDPGEFGFFLAKPLTDDIEAEEREIMAYGWFSLEEIDSLDKMEKTKIFYEQYLK